MTKHAIVCAMLLLSLATASLAQSTAGFAAITGVVRDASGAAVPKAKVIVNNAVKGIVRNITTNEAGIFSAPALPPADSYSVSVSASGFANWEVRDVELAVGQNLDLNVGLQVASASTQVEVSGAAPLVEDTKTDVSQVINTKQIDELPINGRRVDSFVLLTPGVSNDGTFGGLTFRGMAASNSFLVDGNDTTEQYFNENAGRTRIASQISQDAVQEFQVVSSNVSAEYGRASGGVVNTVTRSGGNALHGTMYWFFRNRTLNARDRYAAFNPPEVRHQSGASVGGPIKKDKLFYFFNTEIQRRNFPIVSSLNRPATIDASGHFIGCGSPATPAQCAAIDSLLPRFYGAIPRENNQELAFGKIDYRPTERNSISVSFNFLHFVAPNGIQSAISLNTGAAITSNGNDSVRVRNGRVSWTGIPTNSMVNEFRFGWFTDRQADDFNPSLQTAGLGYVGLTVASQALGAGASYLPRVSPNEERFQFADNFSWTKGRHAMKFGIDIARTHDYVFNLTNQFGSYTYGSVTAFAQDFTGNPTGGKRWQSYAQGFGNPASEATILDTALYAQDQFRMTSKLTLTYGLRYDFAALPQPTIINPDYPQTGRIPESKKNFAPRLGIAYKLNDKTVVRVSYGMFFARTTGALINALFTNNAVYQSSLSLTSASYASGPVFPARLTDASLAKGGTTVEFASPVLRTPYTEQGTVAVERQIGRDMSLTASYLWNRGLQGFGVRDLNIGPLSSQIVSYKIADASGNIVDNYSTPVYLLANRVDKKYNRVLQVENGVNSYYNALALQFRKRFSKNYQLGLSHTWAHAIDYKQGSSQDNIGFNSIDSFGNTFNGNYKFDKGSGLLDQRHRFVMNFVATPRFTKRDGAFAKYAVNNWQISGIVTLAAGRPSTTPYYLISGTTPFAGAAYTNTLNGFGGGNRPPFFPAGSLYTPPMYRADMRISKVLPFGERYRLILNFEAFNVTNSQVDTSLNAQAYSVSNGVMTPTVGYGLGRATGGFPDGTNARRAQVSARFVF
jgi:outer membrane receptor protein involved in Fe transport